MDRCIQTCYERTRVLVKGERIILQLRERNFAQAERHHGARLVADDITHQQGELFHASFAVENFKPHHLFKFPFGILTDRASRVCRGHL